MMAKIYKPAKSAMQSGKANTKEWVLEFAQETARRIEPLMGWTSSADTLSGQVRLHFHSCDEAIAFAKAHNIPHQVVEPKEPRPRPRAYADNFAFHRRKPWTH